METSSTNTECVFTLTLLGRLAPSLSNSSIVEFFTQTGCICAAAYKQYIIGNNIDFNLQRVQNKLIILLVAKQPQSCFDSKKTSNIQQ